MGRDLALSELRRHYDVVVIASGASEDRLLGLRHEERHQQVMSARAFVGWYNGSPEHRDIRPPLEECESVAVIGHGNVALDVARVLLTPLRFSQQRISRKKRLVCCVVVVSALFT